MMFRKAGQASPRRDSNRASLRRPRVHVLEQLESRLALTVFGLDTRYPVPESAILTPRGTNWQHRSFAAVGQVVTKYAGESNNWICSGVLISPRVVLTNAHCVVKETASLQPRYPTSIAFYPGRYQDNSSPYGVATANFTQLRISPEYLRTLGSVDVYDDYALIMLGTDIGRFTGWMDIETYAPSFFNGSMLQSAGYPGEKLSPTTGQNAMYVTAGPSASAATFGNYGTLNFAGSDYPSGHPYASYNPKCIGLPFIEYLKCFDATSGFDVTKGQSGSPIWYVDVQGLRQVTNRVVGLVTASNSHQNLGMRITPYVYNQIVGWMGQLTSFPLNPIYKIDTGIDLPETPNFKPDLTDYDRYFETAFNSLSHTSVERGTDLSYSFRTYNAGTANISEGGTLRVYASTDDTLSDDDIQVSIQTLPALERFSYFDTAGTILTRLLQPGEYRLLWKLESPDQANESDTGNNQGAFGQSLIVAAIPPVFELSPSQLTVDELVPMTFEVRAFDPYRQPTSKVNLVASGLPLGASFALETAVDGTVVGTLVWTPSEQQDGVYEFIFQADLNGDSANSVRHTLTIDVREVNSAPQLSLAEEVVVTAGDSFELLIHVDDADGPADADQATVYHSQLPNGATFDQASRLLRWSPDNSHVGEYRIDFWATDVGGLDSHVAELKLTVLELNFPPVLQLSSVPISENSAGAIAAYLDVRDENQGQLHVVSISDPRFIIDGRTVRLRDDVSLDYESEPEVQFSITATDNGAPSMSTTETYVLLLTNEMDPPLINFDFYDHLKERVSGHPIGRLTAVYEGGPDNLEFEVQYNGMTLVASNSGEFTLSPGHSLSGEQARFDVIATDTLNQRQFAFVFSTDVMRNPTPWQNSLLPYDVNDDSLVSAIDVLLIINELNRRASSSTNSALPSIRPNADLSFFDTNGDGGISPIDVLLVVNELNRRASAGEGESRSHISASAQALADSSLLKSESAVPEIDIAFADIDSLFSQSFEERRKRLYSDRYSSATLNS